MSDDFADNELFTPEELEAMGMAAAVEEPATDDLEGKLADLNEQLSVMAGFVAEGADREADLRRVIHELKDELKASHAFQDVAFKIQELEKYVDRMAQSATEAKQNEQLVRNVMAEVRDKLPLVRVAPRR